MAFSGTSAIKFACILLLLVTIANGEDIFLEWHVAINTSINPIFGDQPVITINGMFPGPLINATTNDMIHVNVFNEIDEPLLFTWNGIQQRLNSWQDGVSGTNCPIKPRTNWTYVFEAKDQIGSFFYFPSINFQKAGGGFGPIRINNRIVINVPFPKPEAEFDLLIGDWYPISYKDIRSSFDNDSLAYSHPPNFMLMNGKTSFMDPRTIEHDSFTVTKGKTYRFRISNVGTTWSFNFRIQNHRMVLVETEGSYTNQITLDSLDVHVGQSYSVLVTADQDQADYFIVASPKLSDANASSSIVGVAVLHYDNSTTPPILPVPIGPDPFDLQLSIDQARSIRWNLTASAARPNNPQGTFNVTNVTLSQTFILQGSQAGTLEGTRLYAINNVTYLTSLFPPKLADYFVNGSGVYELDQFPVNASYPYATLGVFVATGIHNGWLEIVFKNEMEVIDSWHLDGFGFYVVGFGDGDWNPELRSTYNLYDPVVRSTVQVYPRSWTAVYAYLDNLGMWNLRSQLLRNWYFGQELYVRVHDADPNNHVKELPPPNNLLLCGFDPQPPTPATAPPPPPSAPSPKAPSKGGATSQQVPWFNILIIYIATALFIGQQ